MPFPLPQSTSLGIPHFSTAWYDLNYYQYVLMLYRPSPLFPVLTLEKVSLIAETSTMFIAQIAIMQRQGKYAFNWLNLFTVFTATLTLIYSITAQPEPLSTYLQRTNALADLALVIEFLTTFGRKFPSALKCREIVQDVMHRLQPFVTTNNVPSSSSSSTQKSHLTGPASLISEGLTADIAHSASRTTLDSNDGSDLAFPIFSTGNASYDDLQHRVKGLESPMIERGPLNHTTPPATTDPNVVDSLGLSSTPFGSAAAQFMAAGLGASADMDMDEEMLQFIGATSDAWGR